MKKSKFLLSSCAMMSLVGIAMPAAAQVLPELPAEFPVIPVSYNIRCVENLSGPGCAEQETNVSTTDPVLAIDGTNVTSTTTTTSNIETSYSEADSGTTTLLGQNVTGSYQFGATASATKTFDSVATSSTGQGGIGESKPVDGSPSFSDVSVTSMTGSASATSDITGMLDLHADIDPGSADGVGTVSYSVDAVTTGGIAFLTATGSATFDSETQDLDLTLDTSTIEGTLLTHDGLLTTGSVDAIDLNTGEASSLDARGLTTGNSKTGETSILSASGLTTNGTVAAVNYDTGEYSYVDANGLRTTGFIVAEDVLASTVSADTVNADTVTTGDVFLLAEDGPEGGTSLNGTIAALEAQDVTLQDNIDAEETARIAADTAEATTRAAADTAIGTRITTESNTRAALDLAESNARIASDNALGSRITNETNERIAADSVLRDQIASSTATAIALGGNAILPDVNFTLAGNVGFYNGATAVSINAAGKVSSNVYLTAAVGGGLNKQGKVGGRVGVVFGF